MIGHARLDGHYARSSAFQGLLAAARAQPDDDTARLVMADWLDEWEGEPLHPEPAAQRHAAFLRTQCRAGYRGRRVTVKGSFGSDAPHNMKVWFADLVDREPWLGGADGAAALMNTGGSGIYYHKGLPEAVKCFTEDLTRLSSLFGLWRVPCVCVCVGPGETGVAYTGAGEEFCWMRGPHRFGVNIWVNGADVPEERGLTAFVVETVLGRMYGPECVGTTFQAVDRRQWRSYHPVPR